MERAKRALASLPWADQGSISADVESQQVRFKVSDPKAFDENTLAEAFAKVNFRKIEVLAKPANAVEPAKKE